MLLLLVAVLAAVGAEPCWQENQASHTLADLTADPAALEYFALGLDNVPELLAKIRSLLEVIHLFSFLGRAYYIVEKRPALSRAAAGPAARLSRGCNRAGPRVFHPLFRWLDRGGGGVHHRDHNGGGEVVHCLPTGWQRFTLVW